MEYTCKYCLEDINLQTDKEEIVSPCDCKGSMNYVHIDCFKNVTRNTCEICKIKYPIVNITNNNPILENLMNNMIGGQFQQMTPLQQVNLINQVVFHLINAIYLVFKNYNILKKIRTLLNFVLVFLIYSIIWLFIISFILIYNLFELIVKFIFPQNISTNILEYVINKAITIERYILLNIIKYNKYINYSMNLITNPIIYLSLYVCYYLTNYIIL